MKQTKSATRDGFQLVKDRFALPPQDISGLDRKSTHAIKICDLFLNEKLHLDDIVRLLHEDRGSVVQTLLTEGVIEERRKKLREEPAEREPRRVFACPYCGR
jgi:hypothetical protein